MIRRLLLCRSFTCPLTTLLLPVTTVTRYPLHHNLTRSAMLLSQQADLNTNQQLAKKIKLARTERDSFMATYDVISKDLLDGLALYRLPENGKQWIRNMLDATVPGGMIDALLCWLACIPVC